MPTDPEAEARKEQELQAMEEFEQQKKLREAMNRVEEEDTPEKRPNESRRSEEPRQEQPERTQDKAKQAKDLKDKVSSQAPEQGIEQGGRGLGEKGAQQAGAQAGKAGGRNLAASGARTLGSAAAKVGTRVVASVLIAVAGKLLAIVGAILGSVGCVVGLLVVAIIAILALLFFFAPLGGGTGEAAGNSGSGSGSNIPGAPRGCPIAGYITTPYGVNISGYPIPNKFHYGVDIADGAEITNAPVHSTLDGIAVQSASEGGGFMVTVTHPTSGYSIKFLHMQSAGRAEPGSSVKVGDVIGFADNSGTFTTGEHSHYEVYFNGRTVNPTDFMPAQLNYSQPSGDNFSETSFPNHGWGTCNVLPQDTVVGSEAGDLNYYILYGDTRIGVTDPGVVKEVGRNNFPSGGIDKTCPGGITCWDYVIQQSLARGISPAFTIAIWWEEGGFGGANAKSEFGCFPGGNTNLNVAFQQSLDCFLNFTAVEHPYNANDPKSSFLEWARFFCGPGAVPICSNNPNFIRNLQTIYESVAPGRLVAF